MTRFGKIGSALFGSYVAFALVVAAFAPKDAEAQDIRRTYWNDGNCNIACGAETCDCLAGDTIIIE